MEAERKRDGVRRKRAAVLASRRVCMSVYSKEQRQICTNTHLTEHQRAVCSSACKQQLGCSERCLRTPAQTRSNRQPEIFTTHTFQFKGNDNLFLSFALTLSGDVVIRPVVALEKERGRRKVWDENMSHLTSLLVVKTPAAESLFALETYCL